MIRHLFKLVWNRKRTNALITLEIFCSFLVVFVVGTLGFFFLDNARRPLGFSYQNVWNVGIDTRQGTDDDFTPEQVATFKRLLDEAKTLDRVEAAAGTMSAPYELSAYSKGFDIHGRLVKTEFSEVTQEFLDVMRLRLLQGRWFEKADETQAWQPVVINANLAREVYGRANPVGQRFGGPDPALHTDLRVVGVISDFRRLGELGAQDNFLFYLKRVGNPKDRPARSLLVRMAPGTPAEYEEVLIKRLQGVAPTWSFEVKPLAEKRRSTFRLFLTPLVAGGIVALFLMVMVGLGLIGVLWQNLLQRTREMGLRRAAGASRQSVHRQVIAEQLILTTLGVGLGVVLVAQIPVLDLIGLISGRVFTGGLIIAISAIYLLSVLCALYPSAMAARVQPAEALRYE
jgi:putative ABC transport system permease protein